MLRCKNCKHPASTSSMNCTSCGQDFRSDSGLFAGIGVGLVVGLFLFFSLDSSTEFEHLKRAWITFLEPLVSFFVTYFVVANISQDRQTEDV